MSLTGRDGGLIWVIAALFGKAEPAAGWAVPMQGMIQPMRGSMINR